MASSKFRGCLAGILIGDCLGVPFEGEIPTASLLAKYFKSLNDPEIKLPFKPYSDDTAMSRCIVRSLCEKRNLDASDLAKKFVKEYYTEPKRGYGENVRHVFKELRETKCVDPFGPAKRQFGGTGSFGNGAAMRVAPIALFTNRDRKETVELAKIQSLITHTHADGVNGAVLQCIAVWLAFNLEYQQLDVDKFSNDLIQHMTDIEQVQQNDEFEPRPQIPLKPYVEALKLMKQLLKEPNGHREAGEVLGNSVAALRSVPTAIYCFLRAQNPIEGIETTNPFERTVHLALSYGGDTDTIASMAASIAGAYCGVENIPKALQRHCEAFEAIIAEANSLYDVVSTRY